MIILAIDTSCDETSVAVVDNKRILSNCISSQIRYHKKFGGVVPFLAQRLHKERIDSVVELALQKSSLTIKEIEAIAVTYGPGLAPALEVGLEKARQLSKIHKKPLYGINHMAGHMASCMAQTGSNVKKDPEYPLLSLLVSGGHTELLLVNSFTDVELLGETLDDALGEAYDKLAKMLGLPYPGGKIISDLAKSGNPTGYELPVPMKNSKDLNFSYSGLKNACRLLIIDLKARYGEVLPKEILQDVAASFENVAQKAIILKIERALSENEAKILLFGGGVAANAALRQRLRNICKKNNVELMVPANLKLCTDNAAMIGVAASILIEEGIKPTSPDKLDRNPSLKW